MEPCGVPQRNGKERLRHAENDKGGELDVYKRQLHTNPINIGYPDSLGIGAAVIGDGNTDICLLYTSRCV